MYIENLIGKYFLILNNKYSLTSLELYSYWYIEFIEGDIVYGYNSFYGSTLIFKKTDIIIIGNNIT